MLPCRERSGGEWSVTGIVAAGAAGLPWFLGSWSTIVVLFLCYVVLNEVLPVCHCLLRLRWWSAGEEEVELVVISETRNSKVWVGRIWDLQVSRMD